VKGKVKVTTSEMVATRAVATRRRFEKLLETLFLAGAWLALTLVIALLVVILSDILADGWVRLNWKFLTSFPSRHPEEAGIFSAWVGTVYVMALTALIALPIGVGAAIYLEEFASRNWFARLVELNINNLAGVPAIIYGLLGLQVFVRWCRMGESVLAGACTLALNEFARHHRRLPVRRCGRCPTPSVRQRWRWGRRNGRQCVTMFCL